MNCEIKALDNYNTVFISNGQFEAKFFPQNVFDTYKMELYVPITWTNDRSVGISSASCKIRE